ncbi:uncharacterized protein LOC120359573 [Solenopsis invicta]|uniref:uncharacterized protein LOC120359573 n=1 Tax=Solenopsis invicta TaxID=13686 RepID=UPI00193CA4A8|nr:uncharacterized protein LOC120359573 [Solenopsis invicta]
MCRWFYILLYIAFPAVFVSCYLYLYQCPSVLSVPISAHQCYYHYHQYSLVLLRIYVHLRFYVIYFNMATKHLLTAWGFNEAVIDNFVAQEIEIEQFNNLTEEDLKILIPNIGPRRKFQANLKKYFDEIAQQPIEVNLIQREDLDLQESKKIKLDDLDVQDLDLQENKKIKLDDIIPPNSPSASSTSASTGYEVILLTNAPTADIKPAADNKYDLKTILNKSEDGQLILTLYKKEKKLNNDLRNKLTKIIVSNELSPNIHSTITSERACFLSEQLIRLFPTEDKNVWHIKNKKGESQGRGKILTK